jgi:hypothetical protein
MFTAVFIKYWFGFRNMASFRNIPTFCLYNISFWLNCLQKLSQQVDVSLALCISIPRRTPFLSRQGCQLSGWCLWWISCSFLDECRHWTVWCADSVSCQDASISDRVDVTFHSANPTRLSECYVRELSGR